MSTSGFARGGLGWPIDGARDENVNSSGLGWPDSSLQPASPHAKGSSVGDEQSAGGPQPEPPVRVTDEAGVRSILGSDDGVVPALVGGVTPESTTMSAPNLETNHGAASRTGVMPDSPSVAAPAPASQTPPQSEPESAPGAVSHSLSVAAPAVAGTVSPEVVTEAPESVAVRVTPTAQDSTGEPRLRLDSDHRLRLEADVPEAVQGADPLKADAVSRETVNQGGVENMSERDQLAACLPVPGSETPLAQAVAEDARRRISLSDKVFPKPDHTRILTVANQKGGVGKTTTTVNVAAALAQAGLRVLVIDIDPQGNASTALGIDHHADVPSIYDVLVDSKPVVDCIQECADIPNLWCVPATIDLAGAEIELVSLVARETRMERALSAYIATANERGEERLDYVLIDCPPSLGLLTVNAFVAADEVFIPIQCEYYALEGLSQLLKNIELIKSHLNPGLHVSTILLTMYDGRTRLSAQVAEEVRTHFPDQVLRTSVPRSVRISEAPSFGQTVMTYDPTSSGALSYLEAASELAERGLVADRADSGPSAHQMVNSSSPGEDA